MVQHVINSPNQTLELGYMLRVFKFETLTLLGKKERREIVRFGKIKEGRGKEELLCCFHVQIRSRKSGFKH